VRRLTGPRPLREITLTHYESGQIMFQASNFSHGSSMTPQDIVDFLRSAIRGIANLPPAASRPADQPGEDSDPLASPPGLPPLQETV